MNLRFGKALHRLSWIALYLLFALFAGCGPSGPAMVPIEGTVVYNDKPLTSGTVIYVPDDRVNGRQARAEIQSDGSFELTTFEPGDGALHGQYTITVVALDVHPGEDRASIEANGGLVKRGSLIPERYGDPSQSGLTDNVDDDHSGTKRIELND